MEKAKEYGCESFVLFSNTPPVYYTYNGQARSDKGASSNLKTEHYGDFADFWLLVPSILLMKAIILVILVRLTNRSTTGMVMNKKVRPGRIQKWQR